MDKRENVLKVLRGEAVDFPPLADTDIGTYGINIINLTTKPKAGGVDMFGVPWIATKEAPITPANFCLFDDMTEWKKYVKFPDLDSIDWKGLAEAELDQMGKVYEGRATRLYLEGIGIFMRIFSMMGFENALMALYEEPEACIEFSNAFADYEIEWLKRAIDAYGRDNIDFVMYADDVSYLKGMFFSKEKYQEIFKSPHKRIIDASKALGLPFEMHNCGDCRDILDDYVEIGTNILHTAIPKMDISSLQDKYKGRLAFEGGWDSQGSAGTTYSTPEEIREEVRRCIREYGKKPGYILLPLIFNDQGSAAIYRDERYMAMLDEYEKLKTESIGSR